MSTHFLPSVIRHREHGMKKRTIIPGDGDKIVLAKRRVQDNRALEGGWAEIQLCRRVVIDVSR